MTAGKYEYIFRQMLDKQLTRFNSKMFINMGMYWYLMFDLIGEKPENKLKIQNVFLIDILDDGATDLIGKLENKYEELKQKY